MSAFIYNTPQNLINELYFEVDHQPIEEFIDEITTMATGFPCTEENKIHMSKLHSGSNNPFYGKKHTGDFSRFAHQKRCKKVMIDNIEFPSQKAVADAYGVSKSLVCRWVKQGKVIKLE